MKHQSVFTIVYFIKKRTMNKQFLVFFILTISFISAHAQYSGNNKKDPGLSIGHFYGKIVDSATNKPVQDASVQLLQYKIDSVTKKRKEIIVSGMLTNKRGEFSLENLPVLTNYRLKISAIGYQDFSEKVFFDVSAKNLNGGDYSSMVNGIDKDLGNIRLTNQTKELQGVTVIAEKPLVTMSIDKKVYNVEKDILSTGGTAQDIMKNVPGVNVDIDGNVTMRNASPQIFVDGRPTTMTLDQIPSDDIESIEIITNPSAKYDASGGGAGILNIVLKKNRVAGYNGSVRASVDSRGKPLVGGNINIKQGKVNFFVSGAAGLRKSITTSQTTRTDYSDTAGVINLAQSDKPTISGRMGYVRTGMDYFIDNRNTISIAGNMASGNFKNADLMNISNDTLFNFSPQDSITGTRTTNTTNLFDNYGSTLSFKHNYAKPNKDITADVNYNYGKNSTDGYYTTQYFYPNSLPQIGPINQESQNGGSTKTFTAQTDYENPITKKSKIEMGLRAALQWFDSHSYTYNIDTSGGTTNYLADSLLSSHYSFQSQVYAAYATYSHQLDKLSYQVGLRAESSVYTGTLLDSVTQPTFVHNYPLSLFPSVFLTYKMNAKNDFQLNYTRKINRPGFNQLIPYINFADSLNLTKGNPNLEPEFSNVFEFSYEKQFNTSNMLIASLYLRNTNNLITTYQFLTPDPNPVKNDSVIMTSYINANSSNTYGFELTAKNRITRWWDLTSNVNFYQSEVNASNVEGLTNNTMLSWFGKLNNTFKLPKSYSIQLSGNYNSKSLVPNNTGGGGGRGGMFGGSGFGGPSASANGYLKATGSVDMAIKKEFWKKTGSLTLQMSDMFRTRVAATHSYSKYFVQDNLRLRDPQLVRLTFSWHFGKVDASLFKRKNMKAEQDDLQNNTQGILN